jgi:phytoene dehydrogenase-like protein
VSLLQWDVVVAGSELTGLAAAASLAHSGRRVVVLGDDEHIDMVPLGERKVPLVPTLWRLPTTGPAARLIDTLGLRQDARRVLGEPTGVGIIADPLERMRVPTDLDRRQRELDRVFGEEGERITAHFSSFAPDDRDAVFSEATQLFEEGFFARRKANKRVQQKGILDKLKSTDPAAEGLLATEFGPALSALAPFVQNVSQADIHGFPGFLAMWTFFGGTLSDAEGGLGIHAALRHLFSRVIRGHGGEVHEDTRVREVQMEGNRAARVTTHGPNTYGARVFIDASANRSLSTKVQSEKFRKKLQADDEVVKESDEATIVRWLLPREVLPRGLPRRAIMLAHDETNAPDAVLGVFRNLPLLEESKKAKKDESVLAVVAVARAEAGKSEALTERLDARLDALMPYARKKRLAHDSFSGADAKSVFPAFANAQEGNLLGGREVYTPLKNLVRAGRDLVPALGVEGELAVSVAVSRAVEKKLGKKPLGPGEDPP